MEVYRFIKSNIKLLILSLSIIQAILISYICFLSSNSLTLIDFIQLIPAVTLAIWVLPFQYSRSLRLKFSFTELKKMLKVEMESLMISEEELKAELKSAKLKLISAHSFTSFFLFAEFAYICRYVYNSPIKVLFS